MKSVVNLTGVPETMLWTLYNRASEARRKDTFLVDPECVRIFESIDYDYQHSFGKPEGWHPVRSKIFDDSLRPWLLAHPGGTVVELGAGLETEFMRCDDGQVHWLCVDLPEALAVRAQFLPPSDRCRFSPHSALDPAWMDDVDPQHGVFLTAQGLFMYFEETEVAGLVKRICNRFPGAELMFDAIPRWFARRTLKGYRKTPYYLGPPMPWGCNASEFGPLLRRWCLGVGEITSESYGFPRGLPALLVIGARYVPWFREILPTIVRVRTKPGIAAPAT